MTKLTNFIKINNHKLKEHTKTNQAVNNQWPLTAFKKRSVLDV